MNSYIIRSFRQAKSAISGRFRVVFLPKPNEENTMASIKQLSCGRKDIFMLDPELINIKDGWNVRIPSDDLNEHIESLAQSIAANGVKQPLTVYMDEADEKVYVSDGHCRLAGVKLAKERGAEIRSVPCRVEEKYATPADRVLSMLTRNSSKPLTPTEKARVVKQLLDFGWPEKEIAERMGVSISHINQLLQIEMLPMNIKEMVSSGKVSASLAMQVCKEDGVEAAGIAMREKIDKGEKITRKSMGKKERPERRAINTIFSNAIRYQGLDEICDLCDRLRELMTDEQLCSAKRQRGGDDDVDDEVES